MNAERASQVLQRLQVLEQAATVQLNARRGAERALVEAQNRIAQLDQALQQGGGPGTAAGQVADTHILGSPDRCDGSAKACRRGAAEKHLVTKAHESPREQERRLRGVVEKLSSLGQENPCKRRQKMPIRDKV